MVYCPSKWGAGANMMKNWLLALSGLCERAIPTTTRKASSMIELHDDATSEDMGIPQIICDGDQTLEDVERETIIATLKNNNGHRQKSAKALGIGVRTLGLKLKKWKELELVAPNL